MAVELSNPEPSQERVDELFQTSLRWSPLQIPYIVAILAMMVGMRRIV